jgi:hypothetical protein
LGGQILIGVVEKDEFFDKLNLKGEFRISESNLVATIVVFFIP